MEAERLLAIQVATAASVEAQEDARAAVAALRQLEEASQACNGRGWWRGGGRGCSRCIVIGGGFAGNGEAVAWHGTWQ